MRWGLALLFGGAGCSFFIDTDEITESSPSARDGSAPFEASVGDDGGASPDDGAIGADASTGIDAKAMVEATAPDPDFLFADSFDDPAPMPRAWSQQTGTPVLFDTVTAPSPPRVLRVVSQSGSVAAHFLVKELSAPGATAIVCRFALRFVSHDNAHTVLFANITVPAGYVNLYASAVDWRYYGQYVNDFAASSPRSMVGPFMSVEIRVEPTKMVFKVDADVRTVTTETTTLDTFKLQIGSTVNTPVAAEAHFDDVVCRKE